MRSTVFACIVSLMTCTLTCAAAMAAEGNDLPARLKKVGPAHPRLFFKDAEKKELKAKIDGDPLLKGVYGHLLAYLDRTKDQKPLTRKKVGKRLLGVSRECLQRVSYLAFAYRMTGEAAYLKRAEQQMLAPAAFEDWNPSHFLDVAEMTAALAIGYDWLYDDLDPKAREAIRDAIIEKGLKTSLRGKGWWIDTTNNWNQVCHGGLVLGALAVLEDTPELSEQIIARAIKNVPRAMHEYKPDGVYPEGPSYWGYGTTFNVILIDALESVLGSDFGLSAAEGFMETPEFYLQATGPTGRYFNFSDCGSRGRMSSAMHWFAARRKDPSLLLYEKEQLVQFVAEDPKKAKSGGRTLPFLLIWGQPIADVTPPKQLCFYGDGRTPVAMLRSGWDEKSTYLAVKGGSPGTNHAHMDAGSFVLDMDGVRWGIDLGAQSYHSLESKGVDLWNRSQSSERWTVFRLNNLTHNTLVVDGQHQLVKGMARIIDYSGEGPSPHAAIDLGPVYEGQLASAKRTVQLKGTSVLVQDDLKTLDRKTSVRWGMVTIADVKITGDREATLTKDGRSIVVRVLAPEGVKLGLFDTENPPNSYDSKNPGTRMICFNADIAPSADETLKVFLGHEKDLK